MQQMTARFAKVSDASKAADELVDAGIPSEDITAITSDTVAQEHFKIKEGSKVGEGAAIGAGTGGALGALIIGSTSVGALVTGGVGLVAAGPIIAALAGAGAGAAAGGTVGGLIGLAVPEHEVEEYEESLGRGSVVLSVQVPADRKSAVDRIFRRNNAEHVSVL